MRRRRLLILLALALVSGIAAGYLALTYLRTPLAPATSTGDTRPVVVASRDLTAGTILGAADVETIPYPAGTTPATYSSEESEVLGRGLLTNVSENEPVLATKLATREEGGGLPIVIPRGMRAMSVKVDEVIGVAGFVLPGTRVDVIATYDPSGRNEDPTSKVVLQNVRTLAADQTTETGASGEPTDVSVITLLVDPEQAETLSLATVEGQIQLALRNTLDHEEVATRGTKLSTMGGSAPPTARSTPVRRRAPVTRRPSGRTIVTYEGTTRKESEVQGEE